jgi:hypothetical protein
VRRIFVGAIEQTQLEDAIGFTQIAGRRTQMRRDELMKSDVVSEVILVGSGLVLFLPVLALIIAVLSAASGHSLVN